MDCNRKMARGARMTSWRERLCGSVALKSPGDESEISLKNFINPNERISCGGAYYSAGQNAANMKTYKQINFLLPTETYSVLVFKDDGSAVIYSDAEPKVSAEDIDFDGMFKFFSS